MLARRAADVSPVAGRPGRNGRRGRAAGDAPTARHRRGRGRGGRGGGDRPAGHLPGRPRTGRALDDDRRGARGRADRVAARATTSPRTCSPPRRPQRLPTWREVVPDVAVRPTLGRPWSTPTARPSATDCGDIPGHVDAAPRRPRLGRRGRRRAMRCASTPTRSPTGGSTAMTARSGTPSRPTWRCGRPRSTPPATRRSPSFTGWSSWRPRTACSSMPTTGVGDDPGAQPRRPRGPVHRARAAAGAARRRPPRCASTSWHRTTAIPPTPGSWSATPRMPSTVRAPRTSRTRRDDLDRSCDPEPEVDTDRARGGRVRATRRRPTSCHRRAPRRRRHPTSRAPIAATRGSGFTAGDGPDLDHELHSTCHPDRRHDRWPFQATYCGDLDGDQWSGRRHVHVHDPGRRHDHRHGSRPPPRSRPSGVPYDLAITGGTGAYAGATGACSLDNHVEPQDGARRSASVGLFRLRHRGHGLDLILRSRVRGPQPEVTLRAKATARSSMRSLS